MIKDFAGITRVIVPRVSIERTEETLRAAGAHDQEAIVLWAGHRNGDLFRVAKAYVPTQAARRVDRGACVVVERQGLFAFNTWLWEERLEFIAQVHSHPEDAFLSATDVAYPIATRVGNFSIVVPYFGREAFTFDDIAVYRYNADGSWRELASHNVQVMFAIEERP